jgi:uncharacterized protein (DUF608 family)
MNLTKEQIRWTMMAIEERLKTINENIDWNDSQGQFDTSEKYRQERKTYETILEILTTEEAK